MRQVKPVPGKLKLGWHIWRSEREAKAHFKSKAWLFWQEKGITTKEALSQHLLLQRINKWRKKRGLPTFEKPEQVYQVINETIGPAAKIRRKQLEAVRNAREMLGDWKTTAEPGTFDPSKVSRSNRLEDRWRRGDKGNTANMLKKEAEEKKAAEEAKKKAEEEAARKRAQEEGG